MRCTEHRDELAPEGFLANHSGGITGGISSGQTIYARYAIKPTSSITTPGKSIDETGQGTDMRTTGRHDPCVGLRATPRSEEHTSELQSLMRISYAVFCLKKKKNTKTKTNHY